MKVKFKVRKGSGIYVSILAGLAFIAMAITRFDFPAEKVLQFLLVCVAMVAVAMLVAAPLALLVRWWINRKG